MITFEVRLEDRLDHSLSLFESTSIVTAWKEWCRLWDQGPDEYDLGLEFAMWIDDGERQMIETLYYEEWNNEQESERN